MTTQQLQRTIARIERAQKIENAVVAAVIAVTIILLIAMTSCSSVPLSQIPKADNGFYETEITYTNPETGNMVTIPATVYVRKGSIRSVIAYPEN